MTAISAQRLADLRAFLAEQGADACLIPSADPHLSEYLPEHWQAVPGCPVSPAPPGCCW